MPKLDLEKVQLAILRGGGPMKCAVCGELIEDGAPIAVDQEGGFIAHRGCFESKALWMRDQHAMAHNFCHSIIEHMDGFIGQHGVEAVPLQTTLEAIEMAASVFRRLARDQGATKEQINDLRKSVSKCGRGIYEHMVGTDGGLPDGEEAPTSPPEGPESPIDPRTSMQLGSIFQAISGGLKGPEEV